MVAVRRFQFGAARVQRNPLRHDPVRKLADAAADHAHADAERLEPIPVHRKAARGTVQVGHHTDGVRAAGCLQLVQQGMHAFGAAARMMWSTVETALRKYSRGRSS